MMPTPKINKVSFSARIAALDGFQIKRKRVVAYARVSTSSDDQLNSLEAQKQFYEAFIKERPSWDFCGLYVDEGISGLSSRHRHAFTKMMETALSGEIDLIVTKSISRFARNTVDTITSLRQLKVAGCEVFFQREDIWTFDSKGEFLITLLSCMAQEESRNISENVAWGHRKRFEDGRYYAPYKHFLGYEVGMVINESQAKIVRLIYEMYMIGSTENRIAKMLENLGVQPPGNKGKWYDSTIKSILRNEKYKGDALLQKEFVADFLTKTKKKNEGELPQYYVTDGHAAIIPRRTFDEVQELRKARTLHGRSYSCVYPLSAKIICPQCGGIFGCNISRFSDRYWVCIAQRSRKEHHYRYIRHEIMEQLCREAIVELFIAQQEHIVSVLKSLEDVSVGSIESIKTYLQGICLDSKSLDISDDAIRILIKAVCPQFDNTVTVQFVNGFQVTLQPPWP